jgi:hypothetical protein
MVDNTILLGVSEGRIEYAEEVGPLIIHFTKEGRPVLVEIWDAREFLAELTKISLKARDREFAEMNI